VALALSGIAIAGCGRIGFDSVAGRTVDASVSVDVKPPPDARDEAPGDASVDDAQVPLACSPPCSNAHGTTTCDGGICVPSCAPGFSDCDGNATNGCEANLQADPMHCGSCAGVCLVDSGSAVCMEGTCGMSSCGQGTGDCDQDAGDGCETNLNTATSNCGFCGNVCSYDHATPSCQAGKCQLGACAQGYADCDGTSANGCESTLDTISNCGTCGHACRSDAGTPSCAGGTCGTTCDLGGRWATKLSVPVTWPATSGLVAGSGTFLFWALLAGTQTGNSMAATVVPCGASFPDVMNTAGSETYGWGFPDSLFDGALLPTTPVTVTLGGTSPGAAFSAPAFAFLMGLTLANPTTAAWPSTPETVTQVDMDMDSHPGVTAPYKTGGAYKFPPVDGSGNRSDVAYLAVRVATSFSGTLAGCAGVTGSANVTDIDTHIVGCDVSTVGVCTSTQSDFDDGDRPLYVPGSATVALVKIRAAGTCADVRAAL
jgi:hypothetical protein